MANKIISMKNLRNNSTNRLSKMSKISNTPTAKGILIPLAVLVLAISQIYSFKNEGEILGFQVREVSVQKGLRGVPSGAKDETGDSIVCKTLSTDFISKQFKGKNFTKSTLYKDIKRGDTVSNSTCIYTADIKSTNAEERIVVTVSLQEKESVDLAKAEAQKIKQKEGSEAVSGLGDEAYFSESYNQLTVRKGNKVVNIFIKAGSDVKVDIRDITRKMSEELLN